MSVLTSSLAHAPHPVGTYSNDTTAQRSVTEVLLAHLHRCCGSSYGEAGVLLLRRIVTRRRMNMATSGPSALHLYSTTDDPVPLATTCTDIILVEPTCMPGSPWLCVLLAPWRNTAPAAALRKEDVDCAHNGIVEWLAAVLTAAGVQRLRLAARDDECRSRIPVTLDGSIGVDMVLSRSCAPRATPSALWRNASWSSARLSIGSASPQWYFRSSSSLAPTVPCQTKPCTARHLRIRAAPSISVEHVAAAFPARRWHVSDDAREGLLAWPCRSDDSRSEEPQALLYAVGVGLPWLLSRDPNVANEIHTACATASFALPVGTRLPLVEDAPLLVLAPPVPPNLHGHTRSVATDVLSRRHLIRQYEEASQVAQRYLIPLSEILHRMLLRAGLGCVARDISRDALASGLRRALWASESQAGDCVTQPLAFVDDADSTPVQALALYALLQCGELRWIQPTLCGYVSGYAASVQDCSTCSAGNNSAHLLVEPQELAECDRLLLSILRFYSADAAEPSASTTSDVRQFMYDIGELIQFGSCDVLFAPQTTLKAFTADAASIAGTPPLRPLLMWEASSQLTEVGNVPSLASFHQPWVAAGSVGGALIQRAAVGALHRILSWFASCAFWRGASTLTPYLEAHIRDIVAPPRRTCVICCRMVALRHVDDAWNELMNDTHRRASFGSVCSEACRMESTRSVSFMINHAHGTTMRVTAVLCAAARTLAEGADRGSPLIVEQELRGPLPTGGLHLTVRVVHPSPSYSLSFNVRSRLDFPLLRQLSYIVPSSSDC